MQDCLIAYSIVILVINYPIVIAVEWYARHKKVMVVYAIAETREQKSREMRNSVITTPVHAVLFFLFFYADLVRTGSETLNTAFSTFLVTFIWTEAWHYTSHVAMHWRPLHFIHFEHHRSLLTAPWTSVSFSLLEKTIFSLGILAGLAILSRVYPLSMLGIFSYYVIYFVTNTLGHSNFDFRKPGYYRTVMGKIFNSPTYHALHHARYVRNYGLLTPWLDKLFGTMWEDIDIVQTRISKGNALRRLGEKYVAKIGSSNSPQS